MAWGNEPESAPTSNNAVKCDFPACNNDAHVSINVLKGDGFSNSCPEHAAGQTIVGIVEGVQPNADITAALLAQHEATKEVLERAKNSEMEARLMLANYSFPIGSRKEGVNNLELADGRTVKLGHKVNYNLVGDNDAIEKVEEEADKIGNEGTFLIERIITWEAKFSKSEYNKLDPSNPTHDKVKKLVDSVLETKAGTPSLEVREPKAKLNG